MTDRTTEADVFRAIHKAYAYRRMESVCPHVPLGHPPVRAGVGFTPPDTDQSLRHIDALIMFRTGKRWAVEIKVTAADLRQELRRPEKTALWRAHTHGFYYAVPESLRELALAEIPKDQAGLLVVGRYRVENARRAPAVADPAPLPNDTWRRLAGRHGDWHLDRIQETANA